MPPSSGHLRRRSRRFLGISPTQQAGPETNPNNPLAWIGLGLNPGKWLLDSVLGATTGIIYSLASIFEVLGRFGNGQVVDISGSINSASDTAFNMLFTTPESLTIAWPGASGLGSPEAMHNIFTGYSTSGPNRVVRTLELLRNLDQVHVPTLAAGMLTIILILTLERTRLKALGMVVALFFVSLVVPLAGAEQIAQARDVADIPNTLPAPVLPSLFLVPNLLIPALSLAFVGLVQGASISGSVANPDGSFPDASGDFVGQGAAGIAAGLLQGMPVGASMSATSLVIGAGARSRLANIVAGLVIALGIVLFGRLVGLIAMPALAGLLMIIGFRTLKPGQVVTVWKTGMVQRTVMLLTFIAGLLVPLQYAVLLGVGLAVLLYVLQQSNRVRVVAWGLEPGQYPVEGEPPAEVPGRQVTVLVPYGSLFFAAAPVFNAQLPAVTEGSRQAVVILVLRGETELGSTFLEVLARYADTLRGQESRLMLAGVDPAVMMQLERTGQLRTIGRENVFLVDERVGQAFQEAMEAAEQWIAAQTQP